VRTLPSPITSRISALRCYGRTWSTVAVSVTKIINLALSSSIRQPVSAV